MNWTKRPNPDQYRSVTTAVSEFENGEIRIELWEHHSEDEQVWVLVVDDGTKSEHTPMSDEMYGLFSRVLR